jgi:hypothetical protein
MDTTRPTYRCLSCGRFVYCDDGRYMRAEFPPDAALKHIRKLCKAAGCMGIKWYTAGIVLPARGQNGNT